MRRPFPDFPGISALPECNHRLYVDYEDKPGVFFLSLDATKALAVWTGHLTSSNFRGRRRSPISPSESTS